MSNEAYRRSKLPEQPDPEYINRITVGIIKTELEMRGEL